MLQCRGAVGTNGGHEIGTQPILRKRDTRDQEEREIKYMWG